jgi:phosphoribosylformylglycinamidine synthase I
MNTPRALILRGPGTNCDLETDYAFRLAGAATVPMHVSKVAQERDALTGFQILAIPGGFTYGDDLGAGKVFANELEMRLRDQLLSFIEKGGLIIGICNGFQVLVRAGLLPAPGMKQVVSLLPNTSGRFECRWVPLKVAEGTPCIFTHGMDRLDLAVAHGEGRLFVPAEQENAIVPALRYTSADGGTPDYPDNPNGSYDDIAGLTDPSGRILGLMPHPERFVRASQHPRWTGVDTPADAPGGGLPIFTNAVDYARETM